jgi:hypothetical protein
MLQQKTCSTDVKQQSFIYIKFNLTEKKYQETFDLRNKHS